MPSLDLKAHFFAYFFCAQAKKVGRPRRNEALGPPAIKRKQHESERKERVKGKVKGRAAKGRPYEGQGQEQKKARAGQNVKKLVLFT